MEQKMRWIFIGSALLIFSAFVLLAAQYWMLADKYKNLENRFILQETNQKVLNFEKLFVESVLLGQGTVDFESRLKLENAVRDIQDPEILAQWQEFTQSQGNDETQKSAGRLFLLLVDKIRK